MDKLVFLDPNDIKETPFTTSKVIAEHGKVQHHTVTRLIRDYENDLKEFGKLSFEMRPLEGFDLKSTPEVNGFEIHKPNLGGRPEKIYHLNEEQATLLITYMKNTLPVRKFKKDLVKQFYIMQKELESRKVTRELGKRSREVLTNAIQSLPDSPHKSMKYKHYTDLVYKIVFGKTAKQLRQDYGITEHENLRDRFMANDLNKVEKLENQVSVLLDLGYDYQMIKEQLQKKYLEVA